MSEQHRTVGEDALRAEWMQIQAAQREPAQFAPLYERYYRDMFYFVFGRCADEELAAELCARTFGKALAKIGSYQYRGVPFSAWLYRIASNEVACYYRQSQRNPVVCLDMAHVREPVDELPEESRLAALLPHLGDALQQLKPDDVEMIRLRFFDGLPFKAVADILGITESNAKVRCYRVLKRLRDILGKVGD